MTPKPLVEREVCKICGKPSLPLFWRACSDEHRLMNCKQTMAEVREMMKGLPIVRMHL